MSLIDYHSLTEHYGDDIEILTDLFDVFKESCAESLEGLKVAMDNNDFEKIELHAHTLKGMIANFFAQSIQADAGVLENIGRTKSELTHGKEVLTQLDEGIKELYKEIEDFINKNKDS